MSFSFGKGCPNACFTVSMGAIAGTPVGASSRCAEREHAGNAACPVERPPDATPRRLQERRLPFEDRVIPAGKTSTRPVARATAKAPNGR